MLKIQYKQGATRRVLLVGRFAIKFAKLNLLNLIKNIIHAVYTPKWIETKMSDTLIKTNPIKLILNRVKKVLSAGVKANRQEHYLYNSRPDLPLAKVSHILFWGYVLIMERGEAVEASESLKFRLMYTQGDRVSADLEVAAHVCRFTDGLRYIDYGHEDVPLAFS
jgi:hypothetical protein